jgi:hypothetical protein
MTPEMARVNSQLSSKRQVAQRSNRAFAVVTQLRSRTPPPSEPDMFTYRQSVRSGALAPKIPAAYMTLIWPTPANQPNMTSRMAETRCTAELPDLVCGLVSPLAKQLLPGRYTHLARRCTCGLDDALEVCFHRHVQFPLHAMLVVASG